MKIPEQRLDPDDVAAGMAERLSTRPFTPREAGPFHYRQSKQDPQKIDRVWAKGTVQTGRILDGVFVEDEQARNAS